MHSQTRGTPQACDEMYGSPASPENRKSRASMSCLNASSGHLAKKSFKSIALYSLAERTRSDEVRPRRQRCREPYPSQTDRALNMLHKETIDFIRELNRDAMGGIGYFDKSRPGNGVRELSTAR